MVKIEHNKKLFWTVVISLAVLIILICFIKFEENNKGGGIKENLGAGECGGSSDCVPAACCHPDSCVTKEKAPECNGIICTMDCSGPLDCGAGQCGCIDGKCQIVKS